MVQCIIQTIFDLVDPYKIEILISIMYLVFKNKDIKFLMALFIFSRLFSIVIKTSIAMPLPSELLRGFSFPSGHIHICSMFYVWLLMRYKNVYFRSFVIFILYCGSYCEVSGGYHYTIDVIAAPLFSLATWLFFDKVLKRLNEDQKCFMIIALSTIMMMLIFILKMTYYTNNNPYPFTTYYNIVGFLSGCMMFKNKYIKSSNLMILGAVGLTSIILQGHSQVCLNQLKWLFISGMFPLTKAIIETLTISVRVSRRQTNGGIAFSVIFARSEAR